MRLYIISTFACAFIGVKTKSVGLMGGWEWPPLVECAAAATAGQAGAASARQDEPRWQWGPEAAAWKL